MKVSTKEFSQLRVISNYVLVKPDKGNDKIILKSGVVLFLDTRFEKEKHAVSAGEVTRVPHDLVYTEENGLANLDFFTTQELLPGDKIIFHYLQGIENLKESRYVECEGEVYFLIKYDKIFAAIRDEKVIPVNGIVIVEADKEKLPVTSLFLPDIMKGRKSETTGTIRYIGSPLFGYNDYRDWGPDKDELAVGDKVLFRKVDAVPLQYPLHQSIDKEKTLYRMHRRDILGNYHTITESIDHYTGGYAFHT